MKKQELCLTFRKNGEIVMILQSYRKTRFEIAETVRIYLFDLKTREK